MITKDKFQFLIREVFDSIKGLTATKGEEYTGDEDQLANFKRMAVDAEMPIAKVWLLFFTKHVDAIKSYVRTGKEKSEPIESRIDDAILYLILLRAIVRESKEVDDLAPGPVIMVDGNGFIEARNNRRSGKERRVKTDGVYISAFDRRVSIPRRFCDRLAFKVKPVNEE